MELSYSTEDRTTFMEIESVSILTRLIAVRAQCNLKLGGSRNYPSYIM